ncbi:sodium-translocating pyrophosphatase [Aminipila butyrica]|uniref:Putative K(+)-stimulated pyrophosphate-energized sodium pump n=1 Tax=Aminipila butyrica TaxID=433296 RepID=A0A858BVL4_9FIRM|nr:sodium-translocating pyrophosphatase [Aminipila butyrica]QIB69983.1 sodium-translocating pyrophosphatase [Aminipila butyrica]
MRIFALAAIATAVLALVFAYAMTAWVNRVREGSDQMKDVAAYIREGAMTFLKREYRAMAAVLVALVLLTGFLVNWASAILYAGGVVLSALVGYCGMRTATKGNVRAANGALSSGLSKAFKVAFRSGSAVGLCVAGMGLLGLSAAFVAVNLATALQCVAAFGMGASTIALFGRIGGGIYTKSADVGADLVGKLEAGMPEDDFRNPAVIADHVGDNVGDVMGMGADLFESYVGTIIAAMVLAVASGSGVGFSHMAGVAFPLLLAAAGIVASMVGILFVRSREQGNPAQGLNLGIYIASVIMAVAACILSKVLLGGFRWAVAVGAGLLVGILISKITEYYTSSDYKHVQHIAEQAGTGVATAIISALGTGLLSTVWPLATIAIGGYAAFQFGDLYGIGLFGVGLLSTVAVTAAVAVYGPVADNASGIAEMSGLPEEVREVTEALDTVGNKTAAASQGFAMGAAAMTALTLFLAYVQVVGIKGLSLLNPMVVMAIFVGAMLPFLFAALTVGSVERAAKLMVEEVRRQFNLDEGILEGSSQPDYATCVDISAKGALKEMVAPGVMAIATPLVVGLVFGPEILGAMLMGVLPAGMLLAMMLTNTGSALKNAKKYIEKGHFGGKGSEAHKAAVVGDGVGDPLKDASGPALNIFIKCMAIVSLVFAPLFAAVGGLL